MNGLCRWATLLLPVLLLSACSNGMEDLETRVAEVKSRKSQQIEPIPQIRQYEVFAYEVGERRDPFLPTEPEEEQATLAAGPRPDPNRAREPLEEFPLDALRMQGIIETPQAMYALVKAPDGVIHRVTIGNHMGQNYGRVKAIAEAEISLAEVVPDRFGGWITRPATLALAQ